MNSSENTSYQAGQAKGQAEEKGNQMMDKVSNAAQSAKESVQDAGNQMKAKAQGAGESVKDTIGMKNEADGTPIN